MLRYGFFDSEITGYDEEGMPIFDRAESSDFLAEFISRIVSSGILALPGDCFQVVADEGMKLKVRPGFGIIRGRFAMDTKEYGLTIKTADASYKRIDRVILRANYLQRNCEIIVREGVPGSVPGLPELIRPQSGDFYELCLALVAVNSNQTEITQANITDTRYSEECGVVTQMIDHLDTSVFSAQMDQYFKEFVEKSDSLFNEWFDGMKGQLSEDAAGNLLKMIEDLKESTEKKVGEVQKAIGTTDISGIGDGTLTGAIRELNTGIVLSYEDGQYYAQYGEDAGTKKVLGEISKEQLIAVLANSGLGLTLDSTPEQIYAALASKFPQEMSMIMAGWIYSGVPSASTGSDSSRAIMTITDTPNAGWGYYTSPAFDITAFKTLQIVGAAYKFTQNSGEVYSPRIHLVGQTNGQAVSLYQHGGGQKVTENINKTIDISKYTGKYQLRLGIYSHNDVYSWNNTAYIKLTKALLST